MVNTGLGGYESWGFGSSHQVQGFPRHGESVFIFRTDGQPFEIPPKGIRDKSVEFVPAVITYLFPKQAGTNAYGNILVYAVFMANNLILHTFYERMRNTRWHWGY